MQLTLQQLYRQTRELHHNITQANIELERSIKASADKKELVDTAFAMREIAKFADDIRKQCEITRRMAEKIAAMLHLADQRCDSIKTDYCSAVVQLRTIVSVPSRKSAPEEFAKLMTYLGVPESLYKNMTKPVLDVHWPGLMDKLAQDQLDAKPLPPGIDPNKTTPEYTLRIAGRVLPDGQTVREAREEMESEAEGVF